MSNLIKRVIVAMIGIPLSIFIIYTGGWLLTAVLAIISGVALWEFYKICEKKHAFPHKLFGILASTIIIFNFQNYELMTASIFTIFILIIFSIMVFMLELWSKKPNAGLNITATVAGVIYIPLSFSALLLTRNLFEFLSGIQNSSAGFIRVNGNFIVNSNAESAWLLLSIFIAIWLCDSAAYFTGKAFGKHKLFERISPKKTWEGAIGGFLFGIIGFWASTEILIRDFPIVHAIIIGIVVGIIGQIGDLAESLLKRDAGVKDSSAIIPGHGGFLDRFDSILFVVPVVFIYLFLISVSFVQ